LKTHFLNFYTLYWTFIASALLDMTSGFTSSRGKWQMEMCRRGAEASIRLFDPDEMGDGAHRCSVN